jgi:hypothetical protein
MCLRPRGFFKGYFIFVNICKFLLVLEIFINYIKSFFKPANLVFINFIELIINPTFTPPIINVFKAP